jgi:hypothetical protein
MGWLQRLTRGATEHAAPEAVERSTPGIAALFKGVSGDSSHSVLDLGQAADSSLRVYGRFARRVRFANLLTEASSREWPSALAALPAQPDNPYDLLFAWDILDRLGKEDRPGLVQRLVEVSAGDARLHIVVDSSGRQAAEPLRYVLQDVDRLRTEATGPPRQLPAPLLPGEVDRLLAPFQVVNGFTLKVGVREYLAVRREPARSTSRWTRA